jgi:phosphate transport system protein
MTTPQPHDHIVRSLDEGQQHLLETLLRMGDMAAAQLEAALDLIDRPDEGMAARIVANDEAIDALEREIGQDVMHLALRGPLARDLREILAALRIASDLERIGDHATNIAESVCFLVEGDDALPPREKRDDASLPSALPRS